MPKSIAAMRLPGIANRLPWCRSAQEGVDQRAREDGQIVARRDQCVAPRQLDAIDPIERQHLAGRARPIDRGNDEARFGGHALGEFGRGRRLAPQVELARGPALEGLDHEPRLEPRDLAAERLDLRGGPFVGVDRAGEILLDVRAEHLDRHVAAIGGDRAVDLRDRGGADRRLVDRPIRGLDRPTERGFDLYSDLREGDRRQRILQPQQIERRGIADQIGSRRQRLAELHGGRPDRLERVGVARRSRDTCAEPQQPQEASQLGRRVGIAFQPAQCAVPREDAAPFEEPPAVDERSGQIFQPLWIATSPPSSGSTRVRTKPASRIIASNAGMSGKRRIDSIR